MRILEMTDYFAYAYKLVVAKRFEIKRLHCSQFFHGTHINK